ncbi:MAG: helix-turn-helix domain-containing protein [Luteolibacter sp.]|nr:helix-turn-helix domain-containing protein [Luteolibacter sp.]
MQNFSYRLEEAIQRSGKPKGELATHCGVALSTVSRWLAGSVPKAETLEIIAGFLGVSAKWLVFGGDDLASGAIVREDPAIYRTRARPELSLEEKVARMESLLAGMAEKLESLAADIKRGL